ncbi:MAG: hypothetical protein IPM77_02320 [Crocinitomicaceae bacterium]|nr:hypothetical protein [Crocinitomicaceae bacterium]
MRFLLLIAGLLLFAPAYSQYKEKRVEKPEGIFIYCYHKNGKISTEEFRNTAPDYMSQGYAKAFNKEGKEIYAETTSRTGLISSVHFSYYESGAVKKAVYSSHPDAGIQWYRKYTEFDEDGNITNVTELSDDMTTTTVLTVPDTAYHRIEKEREQREREKQQKELNEKREQYVNDSLAFYVSGKIENEDGTVTEFISDPANGMRQTVITRSGKQVQVLIEYFDKSKGIHSVRRTYFKNGRIHEEFIYEAQIWHYREYDKKGKLVREILNQSVAHSKKSW